ncbi:GDSL-type esterase/lipase family protein [Niveibacterium sp. SC-1]|uniref:GDSL-type esterase/lipase family protein n=1 Tax=Niveibacterium sp. SC-1 TaxID=3135646 RepID=UPI00311F3183
MPKAHRFAFDMLLRLLALLATTLLLLAAGPGWAANPRHVLVFGDSNSWGWEPVKEGFPVRRYPLAQTWPQQLARALGPGVMLHTDALSGRTVDLDFPADTHIGTLVDVDFNGRRALPAAIARELPLDLVIIMLGTNDLQHDFARSPQAIAESAMQLAKLARDSAGGVFTRYTRPPRVLVITPPPLGDTSATPIRQYYDDDAIARSRQLGAAFRSAGEAAGVSVFDAGSVTATQGVDGIHLTPANHRALARGVLPEVRRLLDGHE